jgi:hypothetical protein
MSRHLNNERQKHKTGYIKSKERTLGERGRQIRRVKKGEYD